MIPVNRSLTNGKSEGDHHSLFLGTKKDLNNIEWLKQSNITGIISIQEKNVFDYDQLENIGITNLCFVCQSETVFANYLPHFEQVNSTLERFLNTGNVLVQCEDGLSRSVALVIAFLIEKKAFRFSEAFGYVKRKRQSVSPSFYPNLEN